MASSELNRALSSGDRSAVRELVVSAVRSEDSATVDRVVDLLFSASRAAATPATTNGVHHADEHKSTTPAKPDTVDDAVARVRAALDAIRRGEFVVVADGEDRENEGDLIMAADKATPERLAFMVNETSGLICVGVEGWRIDELKLPQMVERNSESHQTAFTVSIDYKIGTTTGISASDRAATLRAICDRSVPLDSFAKPGHMFPLRAKPGGVLVRPGHTEASVDLARLAGCFPAGALCEIVNKDGTMMRPGPCREFARRHSLVYCSIADLIAYRKIHDPLPATGAVAAIAPPLTVAVTASSSSASTAIPLKLTSSTPVASVHTSSTTTADAS